MKVIRENSKAVFEDLAIGDKYYGHLSGELCVKTHEDKGVRLSDGVIGSVPYGTEVKVDAVKGRLSTFEALKVGQTFIMQGVDPSEQYVQIKTGSIEGIRLGNGESTIISDDQQVEVVKGTFTFHGAE
jgi:hypothetical protein